MAMTKPKETTAALIARLHEELNRSRSSEAEARRRLADSEGARANQALSIGQLLDGEKRLIIERDEQRARTEKAEDELAKERQRASDQRARAEILAQRVEERTRERDEARADLANLRDMRDAASRSAIIHCEARNCKEAELTKERDEAREQLAKLEWAGLERPSAGKPMLACCIICKGFKDEISRSRFFASADQIGHRPTCWFAKRDKQVTIPAGMLKVGDKVTFRFIYRPDGMPAYAIGTKTETVDTTRDAMLSVTATKSEPARPEPRFKVREKVVCEDGATDTVWLWCGWDGGVRDHLYMLCDGRGAHEAELRPAPKYKIGRKANYGGKEVTITDRIYDANSGWYYRVKEHHWSIPECDLKPAPKVAVGEWVTSGDQEVGEIQGRLWKDGVWHYSVLGLTAREEWLTAQIPQHKHDCTGSVFLGQHERFDLWWRPTMREVVAVEPAVAHCYSVDGELVSTNPLAIEARRRAVARGLVK